MSRIAIIPARGGSKRIPRKNIKPFLGVPALVRVLNTVHDSGQFDEIHVSTDDVEIAEIASEAGYKPRFLRPPDLSNDTAPIRNAASWAIQRYHDDGQHFETVVLVYATALLLRPEHLANACAKFEADPERAPLLAVRDVGSPIERLFVEQNDRLVTPDPERFTRNSQDLRPALADSGAFCFFEAEALRTDTDGAKPLAFRPFTLPIWAGVDIDTPEDWTFAEHLYTAIHNQEGSKS
jgi:N-acylneuraminate cytidylyltransferase